MRIRLLVGPRANAVADRMRWLSGISAFGDACSNQFIEFGKAGAVANERRGGEPYDLLEVPNDLEFRTGSLDQLQALQAGVRRLADDDVVVDGNAERLGRLDDQPGHLDVRT